MNTIVRTSLPLITDCKEHVFPLTTNVKEHSFRTDTDQCKEHSSHCITQCTVTFLPIRPTMYRDILPTESTNVRGIHPTGSPM
ncbi:unnamed protein product [Staurois parvus]|uniref:Uncharacterized protein n=1 Tax=Staurois parvus TaxID=386267 RepID=A0ABN9DWJ5_9NEOB|nr:unnamed protein product [Staurois parvus]